MRKEGQRTFLTRVNWNWIPWHNGTINGTLYPIEHNWNVKDRVTGEGDFSQEGKSINWGLRKQFNAFRSITPVQLKDRVQFPVDVYIHHMSTPQFVTFQKIVALLLLQHCRFSSSTQPSSWTLFLFMESLIITPTSNPTPCFCTILFERTWYQLCKILYQIYLKIDKGKF